MNLDRQQKWLTRNINANGSKVLKHILLIGVSAILQQKEPDFFHSKLIKGMK